MLCDKTALLVVDFFDNNLTVPMREELERHAQRCPACREEMESLRDVVARSTEWRQQPVPDWHRVGPMALVAADSTAGRPNGWAMSAGRTWRPWLPLAASVVLVIAVLFTQSEQGIQERDLEMILATLEERQNVQTQAMMQAVMQEYGDVNARNLQNIVAYFEKQRQLDLQQIRAGYQHLIHSDYQTVQSMQQLASRVQYLDNPR